MGRQTAIVATEIDERELLRFMRTDAEVRILVRAAQSEAELWSTEFAPYDRFHTKYYLWNTAFVWSPKIEIVNNYSIVRDIAMAPVIEIDRTDCERLFRPNNTNPIAMSRLYWSRYHMSNQLTYDVREFDRWYDRVIRWVRKGGQRVPAIAGSPYLLPDAWSRWRTLTNPVNEPTMPEPHELD